MPTGKTGPLAQFITEELYVSAVGPEQVRLADEAEALVSVGAASATASEGAQGTGGSDGGPAFTVKGDWSTD